MKELSIEQKAQRFDEALEKARQLCAYPTTKPFISDLQDLFPELKESEDDRMRAMAIKAVYAPEAQSCIKSWGINPDDVIAWLEKQGEQKVSYTTIQNTWKPSDEQMKVLLSEVEGWTKGCPKQIVLESLYQDLKKLKA